MSEQTKQQYEFKAEMKQLLHLIINSLYTNPEVFLRELISNSSDALNKIRFRQLKGEDIHSPDIPLRIKLELDEEKKTFTIEDTGVGMTEQELVERLGTIASSGTLEFIRDMKENKGKLDGNMIGQFGVGFYSAFMVTDEITVETRHFDASQPAVKWISDGKGTFSIEESDREERGTRISFTLKDDYKDFATRYRVESVIRKYSNFVDYPILIGDEEINKKGALWHKQKSDITDEELKEFYKFVSNDFNDPLDHLHLAMEGRMNFKALLFVPSKRKPNFFQNEEFKSVQLYSNRVFVQEDCEELLPEYLRFMEGLVDSEDLPLNVSREVTQYSPIMNKIREVITGKVLSMIEYWAESEQDKFKAFLKEFGPLFKSGLNSDFTNRDRLINLLRFQTSKSTDDELVSLKDYVGRMPDFQKEIYFLSGDSLTELRNDPRLEYFKKKDVEVILLHEPVDSFVVPGLMNFEEKELKSIEKSDINLGEDDAAPEDSLQGEALDKLLAVFRETIGDRVEDIVASKRLVDSAATLTVGKEGMDSHMERMMKMMNQDMPVSKRLFEINPSHPLIKNLAALTEAGQTDRVKLFAEQLYDGALLMQGHLESPAAFVNRMTSFMKVASDTATKSTPKKKKK
ncbi:MAG: molecular chaperone HtpG [Balneolales bacterium]|nr:molecular chaperone HtpG [Balneolales bacterium]